MMPQLLVYAPSDFTVISPALSDPFSAPRIADDAIKIKNVLYKSPVELSKTGMRRAYGRVIAVAKGRRIFFRTAGGRLCAADLKDGETPPACGDAVAIAGFPDTDLFILNFTRASCRTLSGEEAAALHATAEETPPSPLPPDFDMDKVLRDLYGQIVTIRGTVFTAPSYDGRASTMNLLCGGRIVQIDITSCHDTAAVIAPGSEVKATGICVINTTTWNPLNPFPRIDQFTIVTRSCGDVAVVRTPPWWTPARLAAIIAALFAVLIALYGWNYILRRIIRRRERQLIKSEIAQTEADLRVDERTRLAAEIHDALSQTLTGVSFQLDAANKTLNEDPVSAARFLAVAKRTLHSCREELRRCLWDLRNDTLGESDFSEAVRRTIRPSIGGAEHAVRFEIRRQRVSDSTAHAVLSIVRELASNAARHGGARHVRVAGEMQGGKIRFSVRDDGRGFDTANSPGPNEGHFGLQGIKERIARLGGSLKIESTPSVGTKVTVEIGK
jgi:signal transduction histidine kinase